MTAGRKRRRQSAALHTYTFTQENLSQPQDGLSISVLSSKQWTDSAVHPDIPVGAQYNGSLENNTDRVFHNWSLKMVFTDAPVIDSSWNGLFQTSGNTVSFVANDFPDTDDEPATVRKHDISTFGCVMYSKQLMEMRSCTLSGYFRTEMTDLPVFWALVALTFFCCVALVIQIILGIRTREYEIIKSHTTLGDSILVNFTAIPGIRDGAHYHHERYDGKGYPAGLSGEDIPLRARIICVADSYDAMSTNRCYRSHLSREEILRELHENAGGQFDPAVVKYMVDMIRDGFADGVLAQIPGGGEPNVPAE